MMGCRDTTQYIAVPMHRSSTAYHCALSPSGIQHRVCPAVQRSTLQGNIVPPEPGRAHELHRGGTYIFGTSHSNIEHDPPRGEVPPFRLLFRRTGDCCTAALWACHLLPGPFQHDGEVADPGVTLTIIVGIS